MAKVQQGSYFKETVGLLASTIPLLGMNLAIYAGFFFVAILWLSFWGVLGFFLAKLTEIAAVICFLIAIAAGGWAWRMARRYLLYLVKGAHIAAMTEIMCGRDVPKGFGQVSYGRDIIKRYFQDVSALFLLDALINGAVRGLTGMVVRLTRLIPLPGDFRRLLNLIRKLINRSLSYVDEAVLSYAIARQEPNVWNSAVDGIVLYGQRYKQILKTTIKVWAVGKIFGGIVFVAFVIPALIVGSMTGNNIIMFVGFLAAIAAARLMELALYEPFALAYTMVTFHRETQGVAPNPETKAKLEKVSSKFRELIQKAKDHGNEQDGEVPRLQSDEPVNAPQAW